MRFYIFLLAFTVLMPAEVEAKSAAGKSAEKSGRKIANKLPSRVLTFVCRAGEGEPESMIGLIHMSIGLRDSNVGAFSSSIYLRTEKGYNPKTINGTYSTVPHGYVLKTKWQGITGDFALIHIHPAEKTSIPGINEKQICEVTGELESL